jgi:hypothetical protein
VDKPLDSDRVANIRAKLNEMETEYLLGIWTSDRREEWTAEAFEAIRQILVERMGSVPPQSRAEAVAPEAPDTYHDRGKLIGSAFHLRGVANGFLAVAILLGIGLVVSLGREVSLPLNLSIFLSSNFLGTAFLILVASTCYLALRALGHVILLLLDIEDNTRARGSPPGG